MKVMDPNERKKLWGQLDDAARKLGVMTLPRLHIGMLVEKDGIVLTNQREEGHSWLRNGWNVFFAVMSGCRGNGSGSLGAGNMNCRTSYSLVSSIYGGVEYCKAPTIYTGTSDTAFSVDQYQLVAVIGDGNGAGQLAHQSVSYQLAYDATEWTHTISRIFNNNSGDTIIIKEIGLSYSVNVFESGGVTAYLARDVLGSPVVVANGAQLTVTYEISMDFSSIDT